MWLLRQNNVGIFVEATIGHSNQWRTIELYKIKTKSTKCRRENKIKIKWKRYQQNKKVANSDFGHGSGDSSILRVMKFRDKKLLNHFKTNHKIFVHDKPCKWYYLQANTGLKQGDTIIMTPSNGNNFRVTGQLCGDFTGHRWIPRTEASNAELWCFPE